MNLEELTDRLTEIDRAGRRYEFIRQAHAALAAIPDAPALAAAALRALVEEGLGGPARELVQLRTDLRAHIQGDVPRALAALPNGRVSWNDCEARFRNNAAALLADRPHLRRLVGELPDHLRNVHLYRTRDGRAFMSRRQAGSLREWLPALTMCPVEEQVELPPSGKYGPVAVSGCRVGTLIDRVQADTANLFLTYSQPLYLIEPDPVRFAAWMHVADHSTLLADPRVYAFAGSAAVAEFERLLRDDNGIALPSFFLDLSGKLELGRDVRAAAERVHDYRGGKLVDLQQELADRYRDRDVRYWHERFAAGGTILGITSRYTTVLQYSMRDTLEALERLGWSTNVLIEASDHHQFSKIEVCRRILEVDPVMVVLLDHLRYENPFLPENLPVLTWIQDPLPNLFCERAGRSIGPLDFVCGYHKDKCAKQYAYPAECFASVVVPVSDRIFHDARVEGAELARYACDVSFVSNASQTPAEYFTSVVENYPAVLRPMLEELFDAAPRIGDDACHVQPADAAVALVRETAPRFGVPLTDEQVSQIAVNFVYRLFDWGRRQEALGWVADWARRTGRTFRLYGRGWENHPTLADFAAGVIEHGEPLRRANRASTLALQLVPSGVRHQRTYELLACGALPLVRYCPTNFDFLPVAEYVRRRDGGEYVYPDTLIFPRLERVVFDTADEFVQLAERYLADRAYRDEVLADLRAVVLADHTYTAVMRHVTDRVRERLAASASAAPESAARG